MYAIRSYYEGGKLQGLIALFFLEDNTELLSAQAKPVVVGSVQRAFESSGDALEPRRGVRLLRCYGEFRV